MKTVVCVKERVFFNKKIYDYGDVVNMDDDLFAIAPTGCFEDAKKFEEAQKKVEKKIESAEAEGKTVKQVIEESEKEKKKLVDEIAQLKEKK